MLSIEVNIEIKPQKKLSWQERQGSAHVRHNRFVFGKIYIFQVLLESRKRKLSGSLRYNEKIKVKKSKIKIQKL